jgi:cell wall-associated NlpC family hydrolase
MPIRYCLFLLTVIGLLAFAPAASAHHHWHGDDWDDQEWNPPSDWNPNQGQPQETPTIWNQSPPESNPWNEVPALPISKRPTVAGKTAMIRRNGLAAIPKGAPARVRAIISAANQIIGKPYKWGGGHGRLFDSGYDCSGSVSYALIRAGLVGYPMVSGTLAHWGARGKGKYVTIYANKGHVYMEVAGLRLDTSSVGDHGGKSGVRWRPPIGKRFGFAVRHVGGL